jgi:hypothetical protein
MEIKLRALAFPKIPYFFVSVALDVLAAGLGVLGGAENAMLAVKSKRGVESFVRKSVDKLAEWRDVDEPELAPIDAANRAGVRGPWRSDAYAEDEREALGRSPAGRYPAPTYHTGGLPLRENW